MKSYIALDLETTGLRPKFDRIIEIGAIKVENHQVTAVFSTLVNPQMGIPSRIKALTGITDEMAAGGMQSEEAMDCFLEFAGDMPLLGHNILFDYSFVKHKAVNMGYSYEREGMDTLWIARKFLANLESRRLGNLCQYYGIDSGKAHRACDDARATHHLYQRMRGEYESKNPEMFVRRPLIRKVKKQGDITPPQKRYLNDLLKYHKIGMDVEVDSLTKNEASRLIDQIIFKHGKILR
jgi:DNA polymerase-3 subunit alpha (Gram-positive type)